MIEISSGNKIKIDGRFTGFYVRQDHSETVVYSLNPSFTKHQMPRIRYSLAWAGETTLAGAGGLKTLENDILKLLYSEAQK